MSPSTGKARKRFGAGLVLFSLLAVQALPAQAQRTSASLAQAVQDVGQAADELAKAVAEVSEAVGASSAEADVSATLQEIRQMSEQALRASQAAEKAETVGAVKRHADRVFALVWGTPSGLADEKARGAANVHGWKTRWQTTFSNFDSSFAARYGNEPPEITDPQRLGIVGRGRHVRKALEAVATDSAASADVRQEAEGLLASLNNVIGG